jgi:F-type H+-transporting ATPase subunit b
VLIDWFTVLAQVLNFAILVWLMHRFLYKPILGAIDDREERIAGELADAAAQKADAQKERAELQAKNDDFAEQRATLLTRATDDANAERQRLLEEARGAADALSAKRQAALLRDAHDLSATVGRQTREEAFAIARKVLTELAGTTLEAQLTVVFVRQLRAMDASTKERFERARRAGAEPMIVRSALELPKDQRATIQKALDEVFGASIEVRFEAAAGLLGGLELSTNGQKVAWSMAESLWSLEKSVAALVGTTNPAPAAASVSKANAKPKVGAKADERTA